MFWRMLKKKENELSFEEWSLNEICLFKRGGGIK
jgi:hypothetical protein